MRQGKLVSWDWQWLESLANEDEHCVRLTDRQIVFLLSQFRQAQWDTRWANKPEDFGDVLAFVAETMSALLNRVACGDCPDCPDCPDLPELPDLSMYVSQDCDESEDCEMALQIQTINGVDYLVENCCGGATRFWSLTAALRDANGNPISPDNSGQGLGANAGDNGAWDWGSVSGANISCYGANATQYLLGRTTEFAHAIIDFSTAGISVFTNLDEYLEVAKLITMLVTGDDDIAQIEALTKAAVSAAFNDPAVIVPLAAAWNYSGRVTKNDLTEWIKASPWNATNGVPVRLILGQWIANSWLAGISGDLAALASECESGNTIPGQMPSIGNLEQNHDWAVSFDLRVAPLIENAQFELFVLGGVPLGEWVDGTGYKAVPDAPETPHSSTLLRMDFTQGTGGDVTVAYVDYEYVPLLQDATSRVQAIFGTSFDQDTSWNGVRQVSPTWASGERYIELKPYRVLNDPNANGGTGIVRQIALAGTGANPFNLLEQDFS